MIEGIAPGSFRDPSGFVFQRDGTLYRQINVGAHDAYDSLMSSGLYDELVGAGLLVPHVEVGAAEAYAASAYQVIRPEPIRFISYPYEWCFSQLQDAALATLDIVRRALRRGMILKDASAYNLQWQGGRVVFIDTLSFAPYREGEPWAAYRQFCQHFLAPLALGGYTDIRLAQLLRVHLDGVPLDLASRLLPWHSRLRFSLLAHIHLHARSQRYFADRTVAPTPRPIGRQALLALIDSLESAVRRLSWRPQGTVWAEYEKETHYSERARDAKADLVGAMLERTRAERVWDLGANTGVFSRLASRRGALTVAFDADPAAVERNYRRCRDERDTHLMPLLLDLTNPSPGLGWAHAERAAWLDRGPAQTVMALALIHHLAIANNVPLATLAAFFRRLCTHLIIEFVPKEDEKVQQLLASREDIFPDYHADAFEDAFQRCFIIEEKAPIPETQRSLYLLRAREPA